MNRKTGRRAGFTLVEIMIVVAIVGLLTVLALPSFVKSRKQAQGRRLMNEARQIDAAIDQWALEMGKTNGTLFAEDPAALEEIKTYLKDGRVGEGLGDLGVDAFDFGPVGTNQVRISATAKAALSRAGIDWGRF